MIELSNFIKEKFPELEDNIKKAKEDQHAKRKQDLSLSVEFFSAIPDATPQKYTGNIPSTI